MASLLSNGCLSQRCDIEVSTPGTQTEPTDMVDNCKEEETKLDIASDHLLLVADNYQGEGSKLDIASDHILQVSYFLCTTLHS